MVVLHLLFEFRSSRSIPFRDETEAGRTGTLSHFKVFVSTFHTQGKQARNAENAGNERECRYDDATVGLAETRSAWQANRTLGAPSFSPYRSRAPAPVAASLFRRVALSAFTLVPGVHGARGVLSLDWNRPLLNRIESSAPKASDRFLLETTLRIGPSTRILPSFNSKAREKQGKISST